MSENTHVGIGRPLTELAISELRESGLFSEMTFGVDEDEHSLEMHLPYIRLVFSG
jgi:predicted class III extradiol MEMO1 family dioxygenase